MAKQAANIFYWVGILISLPFILLIGASVMRIFSEGLEPKYVNSTFLGIFGAVFSYSVGFMLRHLLTRNNDE